MSRQFNIRLPQITHNQIAQISEIHGLTKTQVIILAVDQLSAALIEQNPVAQKDLKCLKTTARIAPILIWARKNDRYHAHIRVEICTVP
jgi:hypothetical protein